MTKDRKKESECDYYIWMKGATSLGEVFIVGWLVGWFKEKGFQIDVVFKYQVFLFYFI